MINTSEPNQSIITDALIGLLAETITTDTIANVTSEYLHLCDELVELDEQNQQLLGALNTIRQHADNSATVSVISELALMPHARINH